MKNTIIFTAFLFAISLANPQKKAPAPFGLSWEETKSPWCLVDTTIYPTDITRPDSNVLECITVNPPKPAKFMSFYKLQYFILPNGMYELMAVATATVPSQEDPFARKALRTHLTLAEALTNKYGQPSSYENYSGEYLYREDYNKMKCFTDERCGKSLAFWELPGGFEVILSFGGLSATSGHSLVVYRTPTLKAYYEEKNAISEDNSF